MFRPTKRPKKKKVIVTTNGSDNKGDASSSEDEVVVKRPLKKSKLGRKKAKLPSRMSFDVDQEEPKKKKRKGGMGFGGGAPSIGEEVQQESLQETEPDMYGKAAIERLKSQQRFKKKEKKSENNEHETEKQDVVTGAGDTSLPTYIPLSPTTKKEEPIILTGEEAINFDNSDNQKPMMDLEPSQPFVAMDTSSAEAQDWEAQVARRAGIRPSKAPPPTSDATSAKLDQMKQQVASTLGHLKNQQDDLRQAYDVRVVELQQTKSELQRHEEELDKSGKGLEYYQQLRLTLASWVGALRELQSKVQPVQQALMELETEISSPQHLQEWQADVIAILSQAQVLDRVLGRQVDIPSQDTIAQVDEFGRDMKSQQTLQREQRARQRQQSRREWEDNLKNKHAALEEFYSNNAFSPSEVQDQEERRIALLEALAVAKQELSEDYTSASNLFGVFEEWRQTHPDEYKQCFAFLSFADLLGVLVQVDMCSDLSPLHFGEKQTPHYGWLQMLKATDKENDESDDTSPLQQVLDKILIAAVVQILERGAYDLYSTKQTMALTSFCQMVIDISPNSRGASRLRVRVIQYIREFLDSVSIPLLVENSDTATNLKQTEFLEQAMEYATEGQVYRLKNLLANIFRFWAPVLKGKDEELCQAVMDFVSSNFLFMLSSLQARGLTDTSSKVFGHVWEAAKESKWLNQDRPNAMLQAAPLRAAAVAFQQS